MLLPKKKSEEPTTILSVLGGTDIDSPTNDTMRDLQNMMKRNQSIKTAKSVERAQRRAQEIEAKENELE